MYMIKRKNGKLIHSPTGREYDPMGQNATDEELIDQLAKIFVEGWMAMNAQKPGKRGEQFRQMLAGFRFQNDLTAHGLASRKGR